ncbi:uncharacterized protein LOC122502371 [Leptopilina heterotoma]|uniref:uncharacterized protein LOC122502371 n=1 Tax=Leptopilina heterotoma TaxID=63436 RepID=UPI001CA995C3|nr:uncharacterized protein LOC122502371 [Leptopilina heterotoma]
MFVKEADPCDLWRLDVIGISDPIEKVNKNIKDEQTLKFLIDSTILTEKDYDAVFREWVSEGIIEEVEDNKMQNGLHYLPHCPVVKLQSTTVIRPVYDASTKREGFPSLNQCLERGPNLIELVPNAINQFRERAIGVIADIRKAFLQISVNEKDRNYLRFLWVREDKVLIFRHCRVVFGLSCSPSILAAIIKLLLSSAQEKAKNSQCDWSEKTVEKLCDAFYVDNCATSLNSETEIKSFVQESTAIFASRGFDLPAWENTNDNIEKESTLVLGLLWNKKRDTISINPSTYIRIRRYSINNKAHDSFGYA